MHPAYACANERAPLNILVVDDDEPVAASIKYVLRQAGHAVDVFHDGLAAIARLNEHPAHYDVLIADHTMPRMSGLELLVKLPLNVLKDKIIIVSAYLNAELEANYLSLGAGKIIRKPFEIEELQKAVEALR